MSHRAGVRTNIKHPLNSRQAKSKPYTIVNCQVVAISSKSHATNTTTYNMTVDRIQHASYIQYAFPTLV
jgi:hypothetical protein